MALAERQAGQTQTRQIITPTDKRLGYVEAFNAVRERGGLPSNTVHDDILVRSDDWKQLKSYYPAWAREVLVYPEVNGKFKKGKDVVDAFKDNSGRSWILPASSMPEEAVGRTGVALFVDPQNVKVDGKKVIIEADPKSIVILMPFMQQNGWGKVDEATRVPLALAPESDSFDAKRYLWRIEGEGVRPLVRDWLDFSIFLRRYVYAINGQDNAFGVGSVGRVATAPKIEVSKTPSEDGITINGVTPEQFKALHRNAGQEIDALTKVLRPEGLENTRKLLEALKIKE